MRSTEARPTIARAGAVLLAAAMLGGACSGSDDDPGEASSAVTGGGPGTAAPAAPDELPPLEPLDDQTWSSPVNGIEVSGDTLWAASLDANELVQLDRATGELLRRVPVDQAGPDDLTISPDGTVSWTGFVDGQVSALAPTTMLFLADVGEGANGIALADEDTLVVSRAVVADELWEVPAAGGEPRLVAADIGDMNAFVVQDRTVTGPTGGVAGPGSVTEVDLDTGEHTQVVTGLPAVTASTLGPDGALYLLAGTTGSVLRHELGTAEATPVHTLPAGIYDNLAFADDGTLYVSSFTEPTLTVIDPAGEQTSLRIGTG